MFINGTVATITEFMTDRIAAKTENRVSIFIEPYTWKTFNYELEDGEIKVI